MDKIRNFTEKSLRTDLPQVSVGDTIKIYYKFVEKGKERTQPFEGLVIAKKGSGISETMTIRGSISGFMMEKIIPVHSPNIDRIELIKKSKIRRAKLYYLRTAIGKRLRLKRKDDRAKYAKMEEPQETEKDTETEKEIEVETDTEPDTEIKEKKEIEGTEEPKEEEEEEEEEEKNPEKIEK